MQAAQKWTRPRNKRPDDDPHDEKPVYEESEGCENGEEATYDCTGTHVYETLWGFIPQHQPRYQAHGYQAHLRLSVFTVRTRNLILWLAAGFSLSASVVVVALFGIRIRFARDDHVLVDMLGEFHSVRRELPCRTVLVYDEIFAAFTFLL